jgi:L-Ala-D/L-Glu epimerase
MLQAELKTLQLTEPFRIAHGSSPTRQVLRVREGRAVGEAPFVPYAKEDPAKALAWVEGRREGRESQAGRLALDLLQWDQGERPMWEEAAEVLGQGRAWEEIDGCRSLGIPTELESFGERVAETARQFRVLKLKLGSGDLDHDEGIVATARVAAPGATIFADVNGGWSVDETVRMLERLQPYGLSLIEQPIHHREGVEAWRELRAKLPVDGIPIYADESARNAEDVRELRGLVRGVNVKLLKCGTFGGAMEMILAARGEGLGVIIGCMIESSIGVTAAAHLAPWADFVDLDGHLYLADDDYLGITFDSEGRLRMPGGPGIGARPR